MSWRDRLSEKFVKYIHRDISQFDRHFFLDWWKKIGPQILNEFEEELQRGAEGHSRLELANLSALISMDGAIDNNNPNTQRIQALIERMALELRQEVDYTNPPILSDTDAERGATSDTDPRIVEAVRNAKSRKDR